MAEGEDVATRIASRLSWPKSTTVVRKAELVGLRGCEVYDAYDRRVLDGAGVAVAWMSDGGLVARTDPGALDTVFSHCLQPSAPAATQAEIVARFAPNPGPLRVLHDDGLVAAQILLRNAGQRFRPPEAVTEQGTRLIRFLAITETGTALFRILGHVTGDKVTVEAEMLSPG
ncbi:MAG: hypothetical protein JOY90_16690 [Bradyrhizobium sp.]|uniref:hypothetical protein n=1 Tax=Bradyrhizobium sp. TaxID=376 RepID=UPI001DF7485A|nr:hypothetical protein [Bradyrhizobium sp.]MBV9562061.1 hypothetical protein [Bradyrhizobium sp.]